MRKGAYDNRPLTLHNEGALEHDFYIMRIDLHHAPVAAGEGSDEHMMEMEYMDEEPQLHTAAMLGMESTLQFTPAEAGEYESFCTVRGHKEVGMHGALVLREP